MVGLSNQVTKNGGFFKITIKSNHNLSNERLNPHPYYLPVKKQTMKKFLLFFLLAGLFACKKQNNLLPDLAKNNSNPHTLQKKITVGRGKYKTIASIYDGTLGANTVVTILPGTYNDQLILVDGVTYIIDGVTIDYADPDNTKPTVTSNGVAVNCTISGNGFIKRSNSQASVIAVESGSTVTITNDVTVTDATDNYYGAYYGALQVNGGNLTFDGTINSKGTAAYIRAGNFNGTGMLKSSSGYGLWLAGNSAVVNYNGNIIASAPYYAAIEMGSGTLSFTGTANGEKYSPLEISGGTASFKDATFNCAVTDTLLLKENNAVLLWAYDAVTFDNCTFTTAADNAFSIGNYSGYNTYQLLTNCYANKPGNTAYAGPGVLLVH